MKENSLYDKKSLETVVGKTADFAELAKDCVAFSNQTQRGRIMNAPVVQCIKYDHYGEKVNKWLWDDFSKSPYEIIDEIWKSIPEWRESTEISDGMFRRNIPAYPESVIRELVGNSLVHRPYTIRGDIFLNIYPDYIEIVNPGLLPIGVTADNILHVTKKRNEHMAAIWSKTGS